jgi:hypothetical protein
MVIANTVIFVHFLMDKMNYKDLNIFQFPTVKSNVLSLQSKGTVFLAQGATFYIQQRTEAQLITLLRAANPKADVIQ